MKHFTLCSYLRNIHLSHRMKPVVSLLMVTLLFFYGNVNALNLKSYNEGAADSQINGVNRVAADLSISVVSTTEVGCINRGEINVSATGGTAPYEFSLDGVSYSPSADTTFVFQNLFEGSYTVWVRDADQTVAYTSAIVETSTDQKYTSFSNTLTTVDAVCDDSTGVVSLSSNSAVKIWVYDLAGTEVYSDQSSSKDKTINLLPGDYELKIYRSYPQCYVYKSVTIEGPAELVVAVDNITNVNSCGTRLGTAELTATGGYAPYTIKINDEEFATQIENDGDMVVITGLTVGSNAVSVKDACGTVTEILGGVLVEQDMDALTVDVMATDYDGNQIEGICLGDSFLLNATVSYGSGEYTYSWEWTTNRGDSAFTTEIADPTAEQTSAKPTEEQMYYYFVKVVDSDGCETVSDTTDLGVLTRNVINITSVTTGTQVFCPGAETDTITVMVPSVSGDSKIYWHHSNPNISGDIMEDNEDALMDTIYYIDKFMLVNDGDEVLYDTVTIWTENGYCESAPAIVVLEVQPQHTILNAATYLSQCDGESFVFEHDLSGGANNVTITWENDKSVDMDVVVEDGHLRMEGTPDEAGTYIAILTTTGFGNCTVSVSDTLIARELPIINANDFSNTYCPEYGESGEDIILQTNIENPISVTWILPSGEEIYEDIAIIPADYIQFDPDYFNGSYSVVVEQEGCISTATVSVYNDCQLSPGATNITVYVNGEELWSDTGIGPDAMIVSDVDYYSDDMQIVLSDPVKTKYASDTCAIEYRINGGEWIVWEDHDAPVVIDTADIKIGRVVVEMRHDLLCSDEFSSTAAYVFFVNATPDSMHYARNIDDAIICISDTTVSLTGINIAGFDPENSMIEWRYEYRLGGVNYSNSWQVLNGDATPALPINEIYGEDIPAEADMEIAISLRVRYLIGYFDLGNGMDTIWEETAEIDEEIWTLRAVPTVSITGSTICIEDQANVIAEYEDDEDPVLTWFYKTNEMSDYVALDVNGTEALNDSSVVLFQYAIEPEYNDELTMEGFNATFDTVALIVTLTSGNATCPVISDTTEVAIRFSNELELIAGSDDQIVCEGETIEDIKYIMSKGVDTVEIEWDETPNSITFEVVEDTVILSGEAYYGTYHYTISAYGLCEMVFVEGTIAADTLPRFSSIVYRKASCQTSKDAQILVQMDNNQMTSNTVKVIDKDDNEYTGEPISHTGMLFNSDLYEFGPGKYYIEIQSKNGAECIYRDSIEVDITDTALQATYNTDDALCYGVSNGQVRITPIYGAGNNTITVYDIDGNVYSVQTNVAKDVETTFDTLKAGDYYFVVDDSYCQFTSDTFTIGQPDTIFIEIELYQEISCAGGSDGALIYSIGGGTEPYSFEWYGDDEPLTSGDAWPLTDLSAKTYRIEVTDQYQCQTATAVFVMTEPDTIKSSFADTACNVYYWENDEYTETGDYIKTYPSASGCDSVVTLNLFIKTTQYGDTIINICSGEVEYKGEIYESAGDYDITITNGASNGCDSILTVHIVKADAELQATVAIDSVSCNGAADGHITLAVTGGVPRAGDVYYCTIYYNDTVYNEGPIPAGVNTVEFSDLDTGSYVFVINDSICETSLTAQIFEPMELATAITQENPSVCYGTPSASAVVNVLGGTEPYTFQWYEASTNEPVDGQESDTLQDVLAGKYYVLVTDDNGCVITDTATLAETDSVYESITVYDCYQYEWEGETFTESGVYVRRSANETANGCDTTVIINLTIYTPVYDTIAVRLCGTSNDNTYEWETPEGNQYTYSETGWYYDTLKNVVDCDSMIHVLNLEIPEDTLAATISTTPVSCFGESNGTIAITVEGGMSPFFAILPSNDTVSLPGMYPDYAAGVYSVVIFDGSERCQLVLTDTVKQPDVLEVSLDTIYDVTCYGGSDGRIEITAVGGNGNNSFSWTDLDENPYNVENNDPQAILDYVQAGTFIVEVIDDKGCHAVDTFEVKQNDSIVTYVDTFACYSYTWEAIGETYTETCDTVYTFVNGAANECDSTVYLHVTIFTPSYDTTTVKICGGADHSYDWTTPEGRTYTFTQDSTYTDTVFNAYGCDSLIHVLTLIIPTDTIVVETYTSPAECFGYNNGEFFVTAYGANEPYTFYLSTGDSITDVNAGDTMSFSGLYAGAYTVTVKDATTDRICMISTTDNVSEPDTLMVLINDYQNVQCFGTNTGWAELQTVGGNGDFEYQWIDENEEIVSGDERAEELTVGSYTVIISDGMGCTASASITLTEPALIDTTITIVACDSFRWVGANDELYTHNDTVTYTFVGGAANGCDSVVTAYIFIGNTGASFPSVCPDDTIIIAPYGVCTMLLEDISFPQPSYESWLSDNVTTYNNAPNAFTVGTSYTITWTSQFSCGKNDTCYQVITFNYPPCGYDTEDGTMFYAVDEEGNQYSTVRVGCDCWMAENLVSTVYSDTTCTTPGEAISVANVYNSTMYNDTAANLATYGRLYDWNSAVGLPAGSEDLEPCTNEYGHVTGACPVGWYLPSISEWQNAANAVGAAALMAEDGWVNGNVGTNASGFGVMPGGYYNAQSDEYFQLLGNAYFWTSTIVNPLYPSCCEFKYSCPSPDFVTSERGNGLSIRCVKEQEPFVAVEPEEEPEEPVTPVNPDLSAPTVTTYEPEVIDEISAELGGSVDDDGGATVTEYGFCWNLTGNPTMDDNVVSVGEGSGEFSYTLTDLEPGTTYYVVAYATNSEGTSFGDEVSFTLEEEVGDMYEPVVVTTSAVDVSSFSAEVGGYVEDNGNDEISAFGIVWGTEEDLSLDNGTVIVLDADTDFNFSTVLTDLEPNTTYYYVAFATNNVGTGYGSTEFFVTEADEPIVPVELDMPEVLTDSVVNETPTSAKVYGTVVNDGGTEITEYGFCMSTEGTPTLDDVVYVVGTNVSGSFSFDSTLTNLMPGSTYFVAAYAINSVDTAYGEELIINIEEEVVIDDFVCGDSTVVDIDNNLYNTVLIGNQCWLKENLKTTQYADGTPLTEGGATSEASYYYPENGNDPYGLLYSWVAVMGGSASSESNPSGVQGICPDGWHVPSNAEWDELKNYVNSQNDYLCNGYNAKAFASQEVWYSNNNGSCYIDGDVTTNNATGFSAIPVGFRYGGLYYNASSTVGYWSSTAADGDNIGVHLLKDTSLNMYYNTDNYLSYAYSVRCVKD